MEFIVTTDLSKLPQSIEFNADELRAELEEKLVYYNTLAVTPDSVDAAAKDRAALRKWREAVEERRKEIKKTILAPYEAFEKKYKELIALIDAPIASIDRQIKTFEEQEKQKKYETLRQYFDEVTGELDFAIDFDRILDPKWKNKTNPIETICRKLSEDIEAIRAGRAELLQYYADSPHLTAVMNRYMESYDKSAALAYAALLTQQENARKAAQKPAEPSQTPTREEARPMPETPAEGQEKRISGTFRVTGTTEQIIALRDFMRQSGIEFEIVK